MKRNPIEKQKKDYYDTIKFRTIHPRIFYTECCKCGNEFKHEKMYACEHRDAYFDMHHTTKGCNECFPSIDAFKQYCMENIIVPETDWYYNGEPCTPHMKRFMTLYDKISSK